MKYMVYPVEFTRFLVRRQIARVLHDHDHAVVPRLTPADLAEFLIRQGKALLTVMNIVLRVADRAGETFYLFLRHVDDMECQTLGCLVSDPRKLRQLLDQF